MMDDSELLRQYARGGSEQAFTELVSRHLPLVYSAALRQVGGDHELAKDVAQQVFIDLARKAGSLVGREVLTGWLYTSTRFGAIKTLRSEERRVAREQIGAAIQAVNAATPSSAEWEGITPMLDEVMHELSSEDRLAVLLRYFEGKDLSQVGAILGVSDDAARMRVNRALGKLQSLLASRGVTLSAAALGSMLAAEAVTAAPAGSVASITAAALAGTTITSSAVIAATKTIAMTTLQKTGITAVIAVAVGAGLYEVRQVANAQAEVQLSTEGKAEAAETKRVERATSPSALTPARLAMTRASWGSVVYIPVSTSNGFFSQIQSLPISDARGVIDASQRNSLRLSISNLMLANYSGDYERYVAFRRPTTNFVVLPATGKGWNEWFATLFPGKVCPESFVDVDRAIWNQYFGGKHYLRSVGLDSAKISVCVCNSLPALVPTDFPVKTDYVIGETVGSSVSYRGVLEENLAKNGKVVLAKVSLMVDAAEPPQDPRPFFYVLALDPGSNVWLPIQLSHHATWSYSYNPPF
jgi:RNA polymerase sigma factor (sigma-70 family)